MYRNFNQQFVMSKDTKCPPCRWLQLFRSHLRNRMWIEYRKKRYWLKWAKFRTEKYATVHFNWQLCCDTQRVTELSLSCTKLSECFRDAHRLDSSTWVISYCDMKKKIHHLFLIYFLRVISSYPEVYPTRNSLCWVEEFVYVLLDTLVL